jgi:hypothetical protein
MGKFKYFKLILYEEPFHFDGHPTLLTSKSGWKLFVILIKIKNIPD